MPNATVFSLIDLSTSELLRRMDDLSDQIREAAATSHHHQHLIDEWEDINFELGLRGL